MRQATGLGRIFRGAFATRHGAPSSKGSSAPIFGLVLVGLLAIGLLLAPGAGAATVTQRPVLFKIDGAAVPDHPMSGSYKAAVDNATGALYVSEEGSSSGAWRIFRFHPDGTLWPFASTGLPYLSVSAKAAIAVDNSGGANQSRLYVAISNGPLEAFNSSGELLWVQNLPSGAQDVAGSGRKPLCRVLFPGAEIREHGLPAGRTRSFSTSSLKALDVNAAGDAFLAKEINTAVGPVEKWVGGVFSSTLDSLGKDVYLDQSSPTGSIFTAYEGRDERQLLTVSATAGQFRLTFGGAQTPDLPFNASEAQITAALEALPTVGKGNAKASFTPSPPKSKQLDFRAGFLAETDLEQITCQDGTTPLSGGTGCSTSTIVDGIPGDLQEYTSGGTLVGTFGQGDLAHARTAPTTRASTAPTSHRP